jgi:hypothetical protein
MLIDLAATGHQGVNLRSYIARAPLNVLRYRPLEGHVMAVAGMVEYRLPAAFVE